MSSNDRARGHRRRKVMLAALIAASVSLAACGGGDSSGAGDGGTGGTPASGGQNQTLVFGMAEDPPTLDPHVHGARPSYAIGRQIFDTLVVRDGETNEFVPSLAESWEVSPDAKTYTFKLKSGVKFHDGTPFDAEAVVFNLDRVVDPATKSAVSKDILGPYKDSEAVDETTVRVNYKSSTSPTSVLDALSQEYLGMVSPAAVEKHGEDFGRNPVGTGPFVFDKWVRSEQVALVRNEEYQWAPENAGHTGPPRVAGITFRFMPESTTRVAALQGGDIDINQEVEPTQAEQLEQDDRFEIVRGVAPGFPVSIWMNTEAGPFTDATVRRAILHAFDRKTMLESVYQGQYQPAFGPLSPATWAYNDAVEDMYPHDPERAGQLLDEAGWKLGSDGVREKDGKKLRVRFFDMEDPRRGEYLKANLEKVGVDVVVRIVSSEDLFAVTRKAGDYDMASTWFASSDPSVLNVLFLSSNVEEGFAISRWKDEALDDKLAAAQASTDDAERERLYQEIQAQIMDEALLIPYHAETELDGMHKGISGYKLEQGQYPLLYAVQKGADGGGS